ncbi:MAG: FTR1 family iron permease [Alteromonadales bacterium]|nr:FTR1 family iron permease [Alteromonadales bacterium]
MFKGIIFSLLLCCSWSVLANQTPSEIVVQVMKQGDQLVGQYQPENGVKTGNALSRLYFDQFESQGLEFKIAQHSQQMLMEIELSFSFLISKSMSQHSVAELTSQWQTLRGQLQQVDQLNLTADEGSNWQGAFTSALILVLREGVEALLIVALLLSYLRASGAADSQWVVWVAVVTAVVASVAVALLIYFVYAQQAAMQRELMEGGAMLLASVLMVYVSHWLLSKRETQKWQSFIKSALTSAIDKRRLWVVGLVAFLAVFREGAETVLFFMALLAKGEQQVSALASGSLVALLLIVVSYFVLMFASVKFPLKYFFTGSALLLYYLAIGFAGKGVLELQLAGLFSTTQIPLVPTIAWLGVFPTLESIALQMTIVLLLPLGFVFSKLSTSK